MRSYRNYIFLSVYCIHSYVISKYIIICCNKYFITFDIFRIDFEKKVFNVDLNFPQLQMEGEYDVNLIIFNLPIKSTGPVFINSSEYNLK